MPGTTAAEIKPGGDAQWIEDAGGTVIRDAAGRITGVDLRASWVTDTDLRKLLQLPNLSSLDLSLTRITDQGMQELKALPGIVDLNLYFAEYVTDEGLAAIKNWKKLKRLNVHGTKISDTTLDHIAGITTLESRECRVGHGHRRGYRTARHASKPEGTDDRRQRVGRCRIAGDCGRFPALLTWI